MDVAIITCRCRVRRRVCNTWEHATRPSQKFARELPATSIAQNGSEPSLDAMGRDHFELGVRAARWKRVGEWPA